MVNTIVNSKLTPIQVDKFSKLLDVIDGVENKIPPLKKSVFNFKGRKSEEIAKLIIKELTNKDSLVCDPFLGSGSFVISSSLIPRKTLGIELDNYTFSIISTLLENVDFNKLYDLFNELKSNIYDEVMNLYETKCCNTKNFIKFLYFDPETKEYYNPKPHREIKNNHNIKLLFKCPVCGQTSKMFDFNDEEKINFTNTIDTSKFPCHELIENSRINITSSKNANKYDRNFTNRNKAALLIIQEYILKLDPSVERDVLEHALVSSLTLSRISQYGSSSEYIYQVVRENAQETNVWYLFESKFKNICRFKHQYLDSKITSNKNNESYLTLKQGDYYQILSDDKYTGVFDLIYTDPPYTDQVPYIERSQLYRDWLYNFYDKEKFKLTNEMLNCEVVVSNAISRPSKNFINYYNDLDKMFNLFYKCTSSNGIVALTLNLGKNKYFKTLSEFINKARKNGFEYAFRTDLTKTDYSLRKQAAYKNTLSKEMLIFFIKLDSKKRYWYIEDRNIELEISKFIYNRIVSNENLTLTSAVTSINTEILNLSPTGTIETNEKIIKLLKEQFIVDNKTSLLYIDSDKLYISIEDSTSLFYKLYNIIPPIIKNLLDDKGAFTLDDLYFDISNKICNGDPYALNQILEDSSHKNYIQNLIENYCDINENLYVKKDFSTVYSNNSIDISCLDGYEFENLLKKLLIAEGFTEVIQVGGAGDRGIDLQGKKLNMLNNKVETYIFQAKRWISNVGGQPIQRLHSMKMQYPNDIQHAECITTSDFTRLGINEAKSTGIKLTNGNDLMIRLNKAFPGKYYHSLLNFKMK